MHRAKCLGFFWVPICTFNLNKLILTCFCTWLTGDDGSSDEPQQGVLVKESESLYTLWCTGRAGCDGMLVEIKVCAVANTLVLKLVSRHSGTPLFRTRLIRSPRYFEGRSNALGFTLPLYTSPVISKPRYFELFFYFPWDFEIAGFDCMFIYFGGEGVGGQRHETLSWSVRIFLWGLRATWLQVWWKCHNITLHVLHAININLHIILSTHWCYVVLGV